MFYVYVAKLKAVEQSHDTSGVSFSTVITVFFEARVNI